MFCRLDYVLSYAANGELLMWLRRLGNYFIHTGLINKQQC